MSSKVFSEIFKSWHREKGKETSPLMNILFTIIPHQTHEARKAGFAFGYIKGLGKNLHLSQFIAKFQQQALTILYSREVLISDLSLCCVEFGSWLGLSDPDDW